MDFQERSRDNMGMICVVCSNATEDDAKEFRMRKTDRAVQGGIGYATSWRSRSPRRSGQSI
jgi:hypothetical protein